MTSTIKCFFTSSAFEVFRLADLGLNRREFLLSKWVMSEIKQNPLGRKDFKNKIYLNDKMHLKRVLI
jgi:hypothetical protein